ncbi:hypothetical protein PRZ48_012171 [Zasmidium cellare]|uniref:GRIP domain-containing protein n=1 Tax=Zasmidium cellare TaxID=395010 RepID=A0ABR0E4N7_ZASCE|nr:hypothetical protein PRZ48_012171 [Zasmidium cellare]
MSAANAPVDVAASKTASKKKKKSKKKVNGQNGNGNNAAEANGTVGEDEEEEEHNTGLRPPTEDSLHMPSSPPDPASPVEAETPVVRNGAQQITQPIATANEPDDEEDEETDEPTAETTTPSNTTARLDAMQQERDTLRAEVTQLRKSLESLQEKHTEELSGVKEELEQSQQSREQSETKYRDLLGKVNTIRSQLGERLKADAAELEQAREKIDELESSNKTEREENETLQETISKLKSDMETQNAEIETLRSRTSLSTSNWAKERDEMISREAYLREEYEVAKQAMQDWEILATEERSRREGLEERMQELEEQLNGQKEAYERVKGEAETQSTTVDGLQRALRELQEERKRELREMVEESQKQLDTLRSQAKTAEETAADLKTQLETTQKELERAAPFEKEVKEKNLLIGKLRHEAVILNDHLTKALRFLKRGKPEDNVDRQIVTNHFLQFLQLDRSDPKKFQVLQLIAALLGWDEQQREQAGLLRQGSGFATAGGSLRVPVSPFRRTPSTPALSGDFSPLSPTGTDGGRESLAELWSDFLEREAEAGGSGHSRRPSLALSARSPSLASQSGVMSPTSFKGSASPEMKRKESGSQSQGLGVRPDSSGKTGSAGILFLEMFPESLHSSYQQYKRETDFVANWLATTARRCGYVDPQPSSTSAPKGTRLKGKARKLAREACSKPAATNNAKQPQYLVKVKDYVPLAQFIAKSAQPRVQVPATFARRLKRAIDQRKFLGQFYTTEAAASGNTDSRDGHGHFISVLEQVTEILRPSVAPIERADSFTDATTITGFANMFEGLHVEEPAESSKGIDDVPTVAAKVEFTSEHRSDKGEANMALALLFVDIHKTRALIRDMWSEYREGRLDLVAVAVTTNTAIDFIRSLEDDFHAAFADLGPPDLLDRLCVYCAHQRQPDNDGATPDFPNEPCLIYTRKITESLLRHLFVHSSNDIPGILSEETALYGVRTDWASMTVQERFDQQNSLAMGIIPELLLLMGDSHDAEHGIIQGLRVMKQRKLPLIWLDFALQVLLDARHVLGKDVDLAFADLCHEANSIAGDIKTVLAFHEELKIDHNLPNDDFLKLVLRLIDRWTKEDRIGDIRQNMFTADFSFDHLEPFYLLRRDPLWCGLLLYKIRIAAYDGALATASFWPLTLAGAHFYNCLRQAGALSRPWTDMETALEAQGPSRLFVGDIPKTAIDCRKRVVLALGGSPVAMARHARSDKMSIRPEKTRSLEIRVPIYWIFKHRHCDGSGRVNLQPNDVDEILQKSRKAEDEVPATGSIDIRLLLLSLCGALQSETKEITFNYFEIHIQSWKLLRRLRDALGSRSSDWCSYPRKEDDLPMLPFDLMSEMTMPATRTMDDSRRLIEDAGRIVDDIIASDGERATKRRTSQHIVLLLISKQHIMASVQTQVSTPMPTDATPGSRSAGSILLDTLQNEQYSSVRQYKEDTDFVAIWLDTTARQQCGYAEVEDDTIAISNPSRSEGNARSLSREAISTPPATNSTQEPNYRIKRTRDFVLFARIIITNTDPRIEVPVDVTTRLQRNIALRKAVGLRYKSQGWAAAKHEHFISVLEEVAEILRSKGEKQAVDGIRCFAISFADFEVEIVEEDETVLSDEEERMVALACLAMDMDRIMKLVQRLASAHEDGTVGHIDAVTATRTALGFIRSLEDDFLDTFGRPPLLEQSRNSNAEEASPARQALRRHVAGRSYDRGNGDDVSFGC